MNMPCSFAAKNPPKNFKKKTNNLISLFNYASYISRSSDGIWYANKAETVSYPSEGNDQCFEIEDMSFWFQHRNACIIELVKRFPPGGKGPIFDVGGGNGFVAKGLVAAGWDVVLVEPGPAGARNARKRGLQHVVCATIKSAEFYFGSMAAIGVFDVVEHIKDDFSFLENLRDLLQPKGMLYLSVPAYRSLWSNEDTEAGHFYRYTCAKLKKKLHNAGMLPVFCTYIFAMLPLPIFLFRTLPHLFGIIRKSSRGEEPNRDHIVKDGLLRALIAKGLDFELKTIREEKRIRFGSSCLVVASKM